MNAKIARGGPALWVLVSCLFTPASLILLWLVAYQLFFSDSAPRPGQGNAVVFFLIAAVLCAMPAAYTLLFATKSVSVHEEGITKHRLWSKRNAEIQFHQIGRAEIEKYKPGMHSIRRAEAAAVFDREHTSAML